MSVLSLFTFIYYSILVIGMTPQDQIRALHELYNSTEGNLWNWKDAEYGKRWNFTFSNSTISTPSYMHDPCSDTNQTWQGITCTSLPSFCQVNRCSILSLSLNSYDLSGTIPSKFCSLLTTLTYLEILGSPSLVGILPPTIGSMLNLKRLILEKNRLSQTIPSQISALTQLEFLDLGSNQFDGTLPFVNDGFPQLRILYLHDNFFSKSIPAEIATFSTLRSLALGGNLFTGSIPTEFGSAQKLVSLYLEDNLLTGSIPTSIGFLSSLLFLYLHINCLEGSLPSQLGLLSRLQQCDLYINRLTGTIPLEIYQLSQLRKLDVYDNLLNGTISSDIGNLSSIRGLFLHNNFFSGTIPTQLARLTNLNTFYLSSNCLTGSIPNELLTLTKMEILLLSGNKFVGTLSSNFSNLVNLQLLRLQYNFLSGTLPSSLFQLSQLQFLYLDHNYFVGTIPDSVGSALLLKDFMLSSNLFTGTIPPSLSNLHELVYLQLYENLLRGTIPFYLDEFPNLEQLLLHKNRFSGDITKLFSSKMNVSSLKIRNIDLSENVLSGSIPSTIFLFPSLETISLSSNCFRYDLPVTICNANLSELILMSGLGSSTDCPNIAKVPFTSVSLVQTISGSIPECVWFLSNLRILNLAGNGLRGTIGSTADMPALDSLILSHNYLSGYVPLWLQEKDLSELDLTHNKFTGDIHGFTERNFSSNIERVLKLSVNRLSGDVPEVLGRYSTLDILTGNLFSCAYLPNNDPNSDSVTCGSEEYDQTIILMITLIGLVVLIALVFCVVRISILHKSENFYLQWIQKRYLDIHHLIQYFQYASILESFPFPAIFNFSSLVISLLKYVTILGILSFLISLPIYILKELDMHSVENDRNNSQIPTYITHTHVYLWLWSMTFVSSNIPAILLMLLCFVSLVFYVYFIDELGKSWIIQQSVTNTTGNKLTKTEHHYGIVVWGIFFLNILIVGTVNGIYIWSTVVQISYESRQWIQISFSLFSFIWSALILRNIITSEVRESRYGVWLFTCLTVVNNVVIPCVATALTSPTCYQRLLVPPEDITSSYSYDFCVIYSKRSDSVECTLVFDAQMDILRVTPAFSYSYQCGSTLLTSYIPVYMYSISLKLLLIGIKVLILIVGSLPHDHYFSKWIIKLSAGIYWPNYWNYYIDNFPKDGNFHRLFKPSNLVSQMFSDIILLLSFGYMTPLLCWYVILSLWINLSCWLIIIGRFVVTRVGMLSSIYSVSVTEISSQKDSAESSVDLSHDPLLKHLNHQFDKIPSYLLVSKWPILIPSCLFTTLICWDIVGDKQGWFRALWIPVAGIVMIGVLWMWDQYCISKIRSIYHGRSPSPMQFTIRPSEIEITHSKLHDPLEM